MAYTQTISMLRRDFVEGRRQEVWRILETEATSTSEWQVPTPDFSTISLVEAELTGTGTAVSIRPTFGYEPGFVVDGAGYIDRAAAAAAAIRLDTDRRLTARETPETLVGRSTPDVTLDGTQQIETWVTLIWGHR